MPAPSLESPFSDRAPLRICVVSHTHWDREWYHTAARFRQRLVALMDAVLERNTVGETFLLDGQAITLLDYLAVRPEREAELVTRLQAGLLEAGPWFVLADNLIPSGEAMLRNLEAGHRVLRRLGTVPPPVVYCPDTFGHPAAMPAVAAGYGFPVAIVWRGVGGASHPASDAFRWTAADGSSVVAHHLPPDGYEYGSALPATPADAHKRWSRLQPVLTERNRTGVVLLLNGADHHALQPDVVDAVSALRAAAAPDATVQRCSLTAFVDLFDTASRAAELPVVLGELRDSYGYTWTLGGTLGTRAQQKRRNAKLERALLHDVEPWLVLAWLHEAATMASATARATALSGTLTLKQLPALLNCAWQELLETHPHDTLCGCSIDAVSRAMDARQESVQSQVSGLREAALQHALQHDVVAARSRSINSGADHAIVVRNRAAVSRGGVAELHVIETLADVAVGPGGADAPLAIASALGCEPPVTKALVGLVHQPLDARIAHWRRESPQHYPDNDLVRVHRVLAWIPEVPALGIRVLSEQRRVADGREHREERDTPPSVRLEETASRIVLDNDGVRITICDGQVAIEQFARRIDDALHLSTTCDLGDSYTPSLRGAPEPLRCVETSVVHRGPLRAAVRLCWESAARDIRVQTTLVLDAAAEVVRCDVRGVNRRRNHRLQLAWRTGFTNAVTVADAAFGPVERVVAVAAANAREMVVPTMPMHRWATQLQHAQCVTLFSDGLAEVESKPDAFALTLVRAIGELSRADLPERPGHAGWPAPIPAAQCLGRFRARVGVLLHGDGADRAQTVSRAADALLLPLCGDSWRDLNVAQTPAIIAGPALHGDGLEASAVTLAQHSHGIVLRAVNLTSKPVAGYWRLPYNGPWLVTPCRLDETPVGPAIVRDARIAFTAGPREIVTMLVAPVTRTDS